MRARRGAIVGSVLVGLYAISLAVVVVSTDDGHLRPGDRASDVSAADELISAWARAGQATFVRQGTFERRSEVTGASIASEDVLVQRPPRRIHRQLGGVDGRDDDRSVLCPAAPDGAEPAACQLGRPGGPTYAASAATELEGLRSILLGSSPLYGVARGSEPGCFELAQLRTDPRAPFGQEARFCFDAATGAPAGSRVRYAGGIVEVVAVVEIHAEVTDADLEP